MLGIKSRANLPRRYRGQAPRTTGHPQPATFVQPPQDQWTTGRTPTDVATILARAETIARDYFGTGFPTIPW